MSTTKCLSEEDLKHYCQLNNYEFNIIDLDQINTQSNVNKKYYFVYTGDKNNEYNGNNPHHFFLIIGNYYFDSFGSHDNITLPDEYKLINTVPNQLQEYYDQHKDSVCGQYCCLFLKTWHENKSELSNLGKIFVEEYGLTRNRHRNDEIVAKEYEKQIKGTQSSESSSEDEEES